MEKKVAGQEPTLMDLANDASKGGATMAKKIGKILAEFNMEEDEEEIIIKLIKNNEVKDFWYFFISRKELMKDKIEIQICRQCNGDFIDVIATYKIQEGVL